MSDGVTLTKTSDGLNDQMKALLSKASNFQGAASRIYPIYQRLQTNRFMTQNGSEGQTWAALNETYAERKKKVYGGGPKRGGGNWLTFPGSGNQMMIATGTLGGAVIGPGAPFEGVDRHRVLFGASSMEIMVEESGVNGYGKKFDYGHFANKLRPVMKFGPASIAEMKTALKKYLFKGPE